MLDSSLEKSRLICAQSNQNLTLLCLILNFVGSEGRRPRDCLFVGLGSTSGIDRSLRSWAWTVCSHSVSPHSQSVTKSWTNELASRRKLKTSIYLRIRLTCDDLRSLWPKLNLHANRRESITVSVASQPSQDKLSDVHSLF